jgi:hypothetical protein
MTDAALATPPTAGRTAPRFVRASDAETPPIVPG